MKIAPIDSKFTDMGIELLRVKMMQPERSMREIGESFGLNKYETETASTTAQYHLGIVLKSQPNKGHNNPYIRVTEVPPVAVNFGDIPDLYLAPEPDFMKSVNLNKLEKTNDDKAFNYMSNKF
jgi:hypothetical protein